MKSGLLCENGEKHGVVRIELMVDEFTLKGDHPEQEVFTLLLISDYF